MEQRPDPITKSYIAELAKKKQLLDIETMHAVVLFHQQQQQQQSNKAKKKPSSKKRPAAAAVEPVAKKEPKLKPEDWLCEGDVAKGTPCPLSPDDQKYSAHRTRHNNKLHNLCKQCRKTVKAAAAAAE